LLYWPLRRRAWPYRILFYLLAFFVVPLFSIAALGAYVGPERTPGGLLPVLVIVLLTIFVRRRALRADATLQRSKAPTDWHPLSKEWPFPLEDPPPRRLVQGYAMSASGTVLILVGFLGAGLAANGVVWPILLYSGVKIGESATPPVLFTLPGALLLIVAGALLSVFAFSAGTRMRARGRRLRTVDARFLLKRPGEGPVLLLRSFDDEELVDPRPLDLFQRRYEEKLSRALKQLGPVITVGRPGDPIGFAGAARLYVSHSTWQDAIRYLMSHSAAVVVIVGRTEGLWWEIEAALECAPRERLLFFFPLVDKGPSVRSWFADFTEFVKRWNLTRKRYKAMDAERRARYQFFRARCAKYLGETLPDDLKKAFFVDFLPGGQPRVLPCRYGYVRNFLLDLNPRRRQLRFNMARTLWPFMAKLYEDASLGAHAESTINKGREASG
jgi:hypothetical protein